MSIYLILIIAFVLLFAIGAVWINIERKQSEKKINELYKKNQEEKESILQKTAEANNEKESMETGNSVDDFNASIDLLHKHAKK